MRPGIRILLGMGFVLVVAVLVANAVIAAAHTRRLAENDRRVHRSAEVLRVLEQTLSTLKDAETGQRGYLLTGRETYLEPYDTALASINSEIQQLRALRDDPEGLRWVGILEAQVEEMLALAREAVALRRERGPEAADQMVLVDRGKRVMDAIRHLIGRMEEEQRQILNRRTAESEASLRRAINSFAIASSIALLTLTLLCLLALRHLASRRRAAEMLQGQSERWRVTLASIGDAVVVSDAAGRVTFMNQQAGSLCGGAPDAFAGRPLNEVVRIINEDSRQPVEDPVTQVLREGVVVGRAIDTLLIAADGTERPIHHGAAPIRDRERAVVGVVLVFRDDTARRQYERGLVEANRRKDEFLAMLAHELRNPLASIRSAVEVFDMPGAEGHLDWAKEVLNRQINHLALLLEDLLDVSRITHGQIQLRTQVIDAYPVIGHAIESVRLLIDDRKHRLETAIAPEPLRLEADPVRLEQVLVNLLANAAHYTPPGGRICLTAEEEGGQIVFRVNDSGIGIPPEVLPRIFDLFAQGDRALARTEGGLGIGLTIVKKLVELHGGSVSARSEGAGRGSEFTVRLPAVVTPKATPTANPSATPAAPARSMGMRILIVDDNRDLARGLSRLLKLLGHQVETAFDGPQGIEAARASRPEVVLLDIGLPFMDGYQVARRLRQEEGLAQALIIAISGYSQEEDRRRSREAGMDHHLAKPVDLKTIAELIDHQTSPRIPPRAGQVQVHRMVDPIALPN